MQKFCALQVEYVIVSWFTQACMLTPHWVTIGVSIVNMHTHASSPAVPPLVSCLSTKSWIIRELSNLYYIHVCGLHRIFAIIALPTKNIGYRHVLNLFRRHLQMWVWQRDLLNCLHFTVQLESSWGGLTIVDGSSTCRLKQNVTTAVSY